MPLQIEQITAAFETNKGEAGEALARVCGGTVVFESVEAMNVPEDQRAAEFGQPGLLLLAGADAENGVFLIPEASDLVPDWYAAPDTTQNGLIQTLALELGSLLIPEELEPFDFKAIPVPDMAAALKRAGLPDDAGWASFSVSRDESPQQMLLTWSCANPDALASTEEEASNKGDVSDEAEASDKAEEPVRESSEANVDWMTFDQLSACYEENSGEAQEALSRAFDKTIEFTAISQVELPIQRRAVELGQPGLLLNIASDSGNATFVFSGHGASLPNWYRKPDTTQNGVLQTLALEVGSLLIPEDLEPASFTAIPVRNVASAFERAGLPNEANWANLMLQVGDSTDMVLVAWSCADPSQLADSEDASDESEEVVETAAPVGIAIQPDEIAQLLKAAPAATSAESKVSEIDALLAAANSESETASSSSDSVKASGTTGSGDKTAPASSKQHELEEYRKKLPSDFDAAVHFLPIFTKSLLRIRVPVTVKLASSKKPVGQILDLSLGKILQFDKACDEPLTLEVNGRQVAEGEVVKIGEKFGLRITAIRLPPERFAKIGHAEKENVAG